jgi:putative cell wall-binding protein
MSPAHTSTVGGVTTGRVGGDNRYATAALASEQAFPVGSPVVVLASGTDFPDALSASGLAGALQAPLLITDSATLSPETLACLHQLRATTIYVVGGSNAVGPAVLSALTANGFTIAKQYAGVNRYDTSAQIADDMAARGLIGTLGGLRTAFVVDGLNFPDGLAAGAPAWKFHYPVIVTDPSTLQPQTRSALVTAGIGQVMIVGGQGAVSPTVEQAINGLRITTFKRFAGANRFDTAVQLAYYEIDNPGSAPPPGFTPAFDHTNGLLITGLNFPDALTASAYAGVHGWPILFDDPLPPETAGYFFNVHPTTITAIGSTNAVSDGDLSQAQLDSAQGLLPPPPPPTTVSP